MEKDNQKIEKYRSQDISIIIITVILGTICLFIDKTISLLIFIIAFWKYVDLTYWNIALRLNNMEEIWTKKKKERR